jgi:hypothetical protein
MEALTSSCPPGFNLWCVLCDLHFVLRVLTFFPFFPSFYLSMVDLFVNRLFHEVLWLSRKIFTERFELNRDEHLDRAVFFFGVIFFVLNQDHLIPRVVRHVWLWFSWSSTLATLGSIRVKTEIGCFSCDSRLFSGQPDVATVAPDVVQ